MSYRDWAFVREDLTDAQVAATEGLVQPEWLKGIVFKAPQLLAFYYGVANPWFVLGLDKGMGKTITYLAIAYYHIQPELNQPRPKKLVILCSTNAMHTQRTHLAKYFPEWAKKAAFVRGTTAQRAKLWAQDWDIVITTPATYRIDYPKLSGAYKSAFIIVDEHHKVLRTRKSQFYDLMKTVRKSCAGLIMSSGSAGGKGPQDVWAALHLGAPSSFTSYWNYVYQFCHVDEGNFGKTIGAVKNISTWRTAVSTALFARKKDGADYPPKTRQALDYEMPPWQKKIHNQLRKELIADLPSGMLITPNVLAAMMALRRFMICPKAVDESLGWGGALETILEDFQDSELSHAVISTPFKAPIPYMETFFARHKLKSERLMGADGIDPNEMAKRIQRWTDNGGLMIQTIDYATSYELPAANFMYMNGYKHSAEDNAQAEDRINRDIRVTPKPSHYYYMRAKGSYDYAVLSAMSDNADNTYNMMHRPLSEVFNLFTEDD